jgi:hypothetical protein
MADYQKGSWFGTVSGTYVVRSNIRLIVNSIIPTKCIIRNEVDMPDAASFNIRAGYRDKGLIAEAVFDHWNTLGGLILQETTCLFSVMKWICPGSVSILNMTCLFIRRFR